MFYYALVIITFIVSIVAYIICNIYEDYMRKEFDHESKTEKSNDLYQYNLGAGLMRADIYSGIFNR